MAAIKFHNTDPFRDDTFGKLLKTVSEASTITLFSLRIPNCEFLNDICTLDGHAVYYIVGATKTDIRQQLVDDFNAMRGPAVFIISTKPGGVGFDIQSANRMVIFDFGYTPATDEVQAIARAYRFGQEKPVFVYWLMTATTGTTATGRYKNKLAGQDNILDKMVNRKCALRLGTKRLYRDFLAQFKGVICSTPMAASDPGFRSWFRPHLIAVDEGGRLAEIELRTVRAFYDAPLIVVGDHHQLPPFMQFDAKSHNGQTR